MDTDGDLVSIPPDDGWGVGVDVGTGTDESGPLVVNAFRQTFEFLYTEVRSVQSVPVVLTKLWPEEALAPEEKPP